MEEIIIDNKYIQNKLDGLERLLSSLTAYGSLELNDYNLILDYLHGALGYAPINMIKGSFYE